MSSSNSTDDITAALNAVNWSSIMFTRYWCIIMFVLGFIGHSLNICVLTRPALRFNPCARYFMSSAIAGYVVIFGNLPVRLLQVGYSISLFIPLVASCKILTFLFSWARIVPCWFIALASIDRFFCSSSSTEIRRWSSIRVSNYLIPLVILFIGLTQIPILIFYTINPQPIICLGQPNLFQKLNGIFILIVWSLIPCTAMIVFGLLTIRHIQHSARRVAVQNNGNHRLNRAKYTDRQLIQITLIQSILFGITSAAGAISGTFNIIDDNSQNDPLELAKQDLIGNVLGFIGLLGPCVSFYLCTLSSRLFRHELLNLFHLRQRRQVHPIANQFPMQQIIK